MEGRTKLHVCVGFGAGGRSDEDGSASYAFSDSGDGVEEEVHFSIREGEWGREDHTGVIERRRQARCCSNPGAQWLR